MKITVLYMSLCVTIATIAQQQRGWCGSDKILNDYRQRFPTIEAAYQQHMQDVQQWKIEEEANPQSRAFSDYLYIPVVFHVIHNGDAVGTGENISDAQIFSQIDAMNKQFALMDGDTGLIPNPFKPLAANTKIQFCLAGYDESGQPTTGINRYNLNNPDWDGNMIESILKPATSWDYRKYMNVWIIRPGDTMISEGVLAYCTNQFWGWPGSNDGILSRYDVIGTKGALLNDYKQGKTLTHEAGHWLGLNHTWGPNNGGQASCNDGDQVSDTPNQYDLTSNCPTFPKTDQCTPTAPGIMFMNYMDYPPDICRTMFTKGQSTRMNSTINQYRSGLKTALGKCFAPLDGALVQIIHPTDSICSTTFNPIISFKNNGQTNISSLTFQSSIDGHTVTDTWTGTLEPLQSATMTLSRLTSGDGQKNFTLKITNVNGSGPDNRSDNNQLSKNIILYNGTTAYAVPFTENFESGSYPPNDWHIVNPSGDFTWEDNYEAGGFGTSTASVRCDNSNSTSNSKGRRDDLLLSSYDFSLFNHPKISFDLAYSKRGAKGDSLQLFYSTDCGASWNLLWKDGGESMATSKRGDTLIPFVPNANEWVKKEITMPQLSRQNNVKFMFRNISGWGNAVYLDNINLSGYFTSVHETKKAISIKVMPNPARHFFTVKVNAASDFSQLRLLEATGREVLTQAVVDQLTIVQTQGLAEGFYVIELTGKSGRETSKIWVKGD